jgi:outer membrane lipoprotein-sorting protein
MKTFIILFYISFLLYGRSSNAQDLDARSIIEKADQKMRGETSYGSMSMKIVRPGWERTVEMKSWSKGDDYFLIYITAPAKEKGQVFLKRHKEMWNWVPSIERMIKIPPSMMMQSWMGSDFTNDDLVRQSSIVKDYQHRLLEEETIREQECYKIELIPLPEAPVAWGKILCWVTKDGLDLWRAAYYDEDLELVNIQDSYELTPFCDRVLPRRMEIVPADEPDKRTILILNEMTFNQPISDNFFSQQNMKRIR